MRGVEVLHARALVLLLHTCDAVEVIRKTPIRRSTEYLYIIILYPLFVESAIVHAAFGHNFF